MSEFAALLRRFTAAVEANDGQAFGALFTDDGTYEDHAYGRFTGPAEIARMVNEIWLRDGRDYKWDMRDAVAEGAWGYANFTFSFVGATKYNDGRRMVTDGAARFGLRDGKLTPYREWMDNLVALQQLGTPPEVMLRFGGKNIDRIRAQPASARHLKEGNT